jgi:hypothetical protein
MKTLSPACRAAMLCFAVVFYSFFTPVFANGYKDSTLNTNSLGCYVQLNSGEVKSFASLKVVTGIFKTPHLVANDSIVFTAAEVKAYQTQTHYAISHKMIEGGKTSFVAKESLPGFAVRIVSGRINVYAIKYYNGQNIGEQLFLQYGNDGAITKCTKDCLQQLIKDNEEASAFLSNCKNKSAAKKLLATVAIYNNPKVAAQ